MVGMRFGYSTPDRTSASDILFGHVIESVPTAGPNDEHSNRCRPYVD